MLNAKQVFAIRTIQSVEKRKDSNFAEFFYEACVSPEFLHS